MLSLPKTKPTPHARWRVPPARFAKSTVRKLLYMAYTYLRSLGCEDDLVAAQEMALLADVDRDYIRDYDNVIDMLEALKEKTSQ